MKAGTIAVDGMFCGHCEIAIQDAIRKLPGIKKAKASKRKKQVLVEYEENQVSMGQIIAAVEQCGYDVLAR